MTPNFGSSLYAMYNTQEDNSFTNMYNFQRNNILINIKRSLHGSYLSYNIAGIYRKPEAEHHIICRIISKLLSCYLDLSL